MADQGDDNRRSHNVINDAGQYSVWYATRKTPPEWNVAGEPGLKQDCLDRINEIGPACVR